LKISGSYSLPFDREKAYHSLHDPAILALCVPGCDSLEKIGEDEYAMKMKMALAAFSGAFTGKIRVTEPNAPESFKMIVEGTGKVGFLKGEGLIKLLPGEGAAELTYDGDVQVGGTIAAVGQRMIDTTAKMMIRKFFEKFTLYTLIWGVRNGESSGRTGFRGNTRGTR
jgi:carbon monoxide dehydrogenase subunit G